LALTPRAPWSEHGVNLMKICDQTGHKSLSEVLAVDAANSSLAW
jgi:hypothetical protein